VGRISGLIALATLFSSFAQAAPDKLVVYGQYLPPISGQSLMVGYPAQNQRINVTVSLLARDGAGLDAFNRSVSDPKSPNYRHFISPNEVGERFGASQQTVDATVAYLKANGLAITLVAGNKMAISAEGTIAQVEKAFGVKLANYQGPNPVGVGNYNFRRPLNKPMVPATLSGSVIDVEGLDTSNRPIHLTQTLTPFLHKGLYDLLPIYNAGHTGLGRGIAITNWGDPWKLSNVGVFYTHFALPTPGGGLGSNVHQVPFNGGTQGGNGQGETDLDIQLSLAQAPLADCYVYDDGSGGGNHVALLAKEGTDNLVDLLSESWGWSNILDGTDTTHHQQYQAMTAQGMT